MIYEILDLKVDIELIYKPENRNTYLRVRDGKIIITTPRRLTEKAIINFVTENYSFVKKHLEKNKNLNRSNHIIHLFGKPYNFKIIECNENTVILENDMILIKTSYNSYNEIKFLVTKFYASYLLDFLKNHYLEIFALFADIYQVPPTYKIKDYKTCFAKYVYPNHEIIFSTLLAKYDPFYIKLVIAHELCHIKHKNHQAPFYALFEQKFPHAKKHQHDLRKIVYNDYF